MAQIEESVAAICSYSTAPIGKSVQALKTKTMPSQREIAKLKEQMHGSRFSRYKCSPPRTSRYR